MKTYFNRLHYEDINFKNFPVILILSIGSVFYCLAVYARLILYKFQILKSKRLPAYTISIGNLTTGGTGKTPITCEIANYLTRKKNKRVAIISRGYGGKLSSRETNIISNGEKVLYEAQLAGDEPYWMATNCKNTAVLTGKDRIQSGKYAVKNFKSEYLLLDDGFQHIKLERDLNIILIDLHKEFGNGYLLPAGPLREPLNQIRRADKVILVNKQKYTLETEEKFRKFSGWLKKEFNKDSLLCNLEAGVIYDLQTGENIDNINTALVFSGIGQPEYFFNSIKELGIKIVSEKTYADHHNYSEDDVEEIVFDANKYGADAIVTTEKDAVKLLALLKEMQINIPVCALKLKVDLNIKALLK